MPRLRWYFSFFLISGFCSLVYEIVWIRLAMAEFGVTTAMVSIVLSMFMAGLGLGSWGAGILARRLLEGAASSCLRFYALAEILVGASALLVPYQLRWGHNLLLRTGNALAWQSLPYYLASGLWVAFILVPWCAFMGATFPLLMAVIRPAWGDEGERSFSYLYVANVLGALLGTLASAFFLIELAGFQGTLRITSLLNGLVACSAFALAGRPWGSRPAATRAPRCEARERLYGLPPASALWMLLATGIVSMGMEVIWIRQFAPYLGNVVYAFATILAFYLLATFWGSRQYRSWVCSHTCQESAPVWALLGVLSLLPLAAADPIWSHTSGRRAFEIGLLRTAAGIGPFCAAVGFLTPLLVDYWSSGNPDRAGKAYAVNVAGCIVGPLVAGFVLLPRLSEHWALVALAVPLLSLGAITARPGRASPPARLRLRLNPRLRYMGMLAPALLLIVLPRDYETEFPGRVVRRDYAATVVATGEGFHKQLLVNGFGVTNVTPITKFMAHLPLASMRRPPRDGLVICFGMGTTFRSMLSWGIPVTAVDLVPSVPALFGYFHSDAQQVLASPGAHIVIDDGRRFLDRSVAEYDVITVDPPPPAAAPGSSLLYSREFLAIVKQHLRPGGILQLWYPENQGDAATSSSIAQALSQSFPFVRAFASVYGWGIHFLASQEPLPPTSGEILASRLPPAAAKDLVEWGPESTAEGQFDRVLAGERSLRSIIAEDPKAPALDDDEPVNEYYWLRRKFHYYR